MLHFKLKHVMQANGIIYPHAWLMRNCGFTPNKASKILNGKQQTLSANDLSFLCMALNCTPNDLLYWEQTKRYHVGEAHPLLTQLTPPPNNSDWRTMLRSIDAQDAKQVFDLIQEKMDKK